MKITHLFVITLFVSSFFLSSVQAFKIDASLNKDSDEAVRRTQVVDVDCSANDHQTSHLPSSLFSSLKTDVDRIDIMFVHLTTQEQLQAFQDFLGLLQVQASWRAQRIDISLSSDSDQENPFLMKARESLEKYQSLLERIETEQAERAARRAQHQEEHSERALWGDSLSSGDDDSDY